MNTPRRAVITGYETLTCLGGKQGLLNGLINGRSGITTPLGGGLNTMCGTVSVPNDAPNIRHLDITHRMLVWCANRALRDAGLPYDQPLGERAACVTGSGKGGIRSLLSGRSADIEAFMPGSASSVIAKTFGITGPVHTVVNACATGLSALSLGASLIEDGRAEVVLCGAAEASLEPLILHSYKKMGVLCEGNNASSFRPFGKNRSGFMPAEGCAMFVLEDSLRAASRGARVRAVVGGRSCMFSPGTNPVQAPDEEVLRRVFDEAYRPESGDDTVPGEMIIIPHGSGTFSGDIAEGRALLECLSSGDSPYAVVPLKPYIGHTLSACGACETAAAVVCLEHGLIPAALNFEEPDPAIGLRLNKAARAGVVSSCLLMSFGFGGPAAALRLMTF